MAISRRSRPVFEALESRLVPYSVSGNAWPHPELITLGFLPDGAVVGQSPGGALTSTLQSAFNARFGSAAAWQKEILRAAQTWAQQTNINFAVVGDSGAAIGSGAYVQGDPSMADIRIGGYNFANQTLAQCYLPPPVNGTSFAGDIQFNTGQTWNIGSTYDLYTVALHEIGHAVGFYHSGVVTAALYPSYQGSRTGLASDDINGIQTIYSSGAVRTGDSAEAAFGNNTSLLATAVTLTGGLTALVAGLDITNTSDVDFFKITAPVGSTATLRVQAQSTGLSLLAPKVSVYASTNLGRPLATATVSGTSGGTAVVNVSGVAPGMVYYVRVEGANTTAFGTGAYALGVNFGNGATPTAAPPDTLTENTDGGGGGEASHVTLELRVNAYDDGQQMTRGDGARAVAMDARGNFVTVWSSLKQDGSGWGVYGRRYDVSGTPMGFEFLINTTTRGDQEEPAIAMTPSGEFVVVWTAADQDGDRAGVYARRFDALASPRGSEFRVNVATRGDQAGPVVEMEDQGGFVVAWVSADQDGDHQGVFARRFNTSGTPSGGEFQVNQTTSGNQYQPALAMSPSGAFAITWSSSANGGSIQGRLYDEAGAARSAEFPIDTSARSGSEMASVGMDAAGGFVVTWVVKTGKGDEKGAYARRFTPEGIALGNAFRVDGSQAKERATTSVAVNPNGSFLVTWANKDVDGKGWGIYGRQFDALDQPLGAEFLVNLTTTGGDQKGSSLDVDGRGHAVVVWSGNGSGDKDGVYAQVYAVNSASGVNPLVGVVDTFDPFGHDRDHDHDHGIEGETAAPKAPSSFRMPTARGEGLSELMELLRPRKARTVRGANAEN